MKARLHDLMYGADGAAMLSLRIYDRREAEKLFHELKEADVSVEIKKAYKRRSTSANAYAWVLIDKLAAKLNRGKEEIYREAIRDIGGVSVQLTVRDDALGEFISVWEAQGLGYSTEIVDRIGLHMIRVNAYYGSSCYDTAQMGRLIDYLVMACHDQGIETMQHEELQSLLESWKGRN